MGTAYEVTYRNMWPSDALNARIRDNFGALKQSCAAARACSAWFELQPQDDRLSLRIEVAGQGARLDTQRTLAGRQAPEALCAEIDAAFHELHRRLSGEGVAAPVGRRSRGSGPEKQVGSSRVDLQACKLEYSIVSPK